MASEASAEKKRESLQIRYGMLQVLYCFTSASLVGFAAIFLGSKGLSSTLVGIATGASCILSVILTPLISSAVSRVRGLSIARVLTVAMVGAMAGYGIIAALALPEPAVIALFAIANALVLAVAPFLAQLAMDFNRIGMPINFSLARGMGSLSYAVGSVVLGGLVKRMSPAVLAVAFAVATLLFLAVLSGVPRSDRTAAEDVAVESVAIGSREVAAECGLVDASDRRDPDSPLRELLHQRTLVGMLVGFMLAFIACNCLSVYLIDIVVDLGGDTSMYGIANFCMAASELPVMALFPRLRRRFSVSTLLGVVGVSYLLRNLIIVSATSIPMVFAGLLFQSLSYGLLTPLVTFYIAEVCSKRSEMLGQTLQSVATTGLGSMIGTVCGGALQDACGLPAMLTFVTVVTVIATAVFFATAARARREERAGGTV